ncbi:hypothetical protein [Streptomyces sp. NPDC058401]|uniref:hypothetical protein n=1 Tax=Streptomyces sp. NPDC058401 TaxID=3346480 RepID=UPI0036569622
MAEPSSPLTTPTKDEVPALLAELKRYVMSGAPANLVEKNPGVSKLVTENFLATSIKEIKEIHGEVVNPLAVELLQQARLDTLAAAVKKAIEGNPLTWAYFAAAAGGILLTIVAGGMLLRFGAWLTSKLPVFLTGGPPGPTAGLTSAELATLRGAIALTTPVVREFNREAHKLPRSREMVAMGKALDKLRLALGRLDNAVVEAAASAIKSLKTALRNFDSSKIPKDHAAMRKTADAIDKLVLAIGRVNTQTVKDAAAAIRNLKGALKNFSATDIPKSGPMNSTARAAKNLSGAVRALAPELRALGTAATAASGAIGGSTGGR